LLITYGTETALTDALSQSDTDLLIAD